MGGLEIQAAAARNIEELHRLRQQQQSPSSAEGGFGATIVKIIAVTIWAMLAIVSIAAMQPEIAFISITLISFATMAMVFGADKISGIFAHFHINIPVFPSPRISNWRVRHWFPRTRPGPTPMRRVPVQPRRSRSSGLPANPTRILRRPSPHTPLPTRHVPPPRSQQNVRGADGNPHATRRMRNPSPSTSPLHPNVRLPNGELHATRRVRNPSRSTSPLHPDVRLPDGSLHATRRR